MAVIWRIHYYRKACVHARFVTPKDTFIPQSIQSAWLSFQSSELGPPPPRPQGSAGSTLFGSKRGDTLAWGEGLGGPNSDDWKEIQALCIWMYLLVTDRHSTHTNDFSLRITQGKKDSWRYLISTRMSKRFQWPTLLFFSYVYFTVCVYNMHRSWLSREWRPPEKPPSVPLPDRIRTHWRIHNFYL